MAEHADVITAHEASGGNFESLKQDKICGCFYCLEIFPPSEIKDKTTDLSKGDTAICPYCGIDAVIGESSGFPITQEFLKKMNEYWF